jgi:hypothetical protein
LPSGVTTARHTGRLSSREVALWQPTPREHVDSGRERSGSGVGHSIYEKVAFRCTATTAGSNDRQAADMEQKAVTLWKV